MYVLQTYLLCILSLLVWMFSTTHVTVCVCHAELKSYLLTLSLLN